MSYQLFYVRVISKGRDSPAPHKDIHALFLNLVFDDVHQFRWCPSQWLAHPRVIWTYSYFGSKIIVCYIRPCLFWRMCLHSLDYEMCQNCWCVIGSRRVKSLKDRLHEVETDVKSLRVDLVGSDIDDGQKRGTAFSYLCWRGDTMNCLQARWLRCPTLEKKRIMSACCCGLRDASQRKVGARGGARFHWWIRSPDKDVWEEDMSDIDPGVGPSGSSTLQDAEADDCRRRYGFLAFPTNRELLDWISEARVFARTSA